MYTLMKINGQLVFGILLVSFLYRVSFSTQRYFDAKIGITISREFSEWRLMPSVSICFAKKNVSMAFMLSNANHNLLQVKNEVLTHFTHTNITEHGFVRKCSLFFIILIQRSVILFQKACSSRKPKFRRGLNTYKWFFQKPEQNLCYV